MMEKAIFGYGGHAKEVSVQLKENVTFFVDDEYTNGECKPLSEFNPKKYEIIIAISDTEKRMGVVERLPKETKYFTFIHPTAQIMDENISFGEGSFIGANTILTTNINIGKHCILNRGNQIGHDCIIGDFFSAMPGAIISGNVNIGDCVYIGTNSTIIEKINVCSNVKIGANSVTTKNIEKTGTYVGVPSKILKK